MPRAPALCLLLAPVLSDTISFNEGLSTIPKLHNEDAEGQTELLRWTTHKTVSSVGEL